MAKPKVYKKVATPAKGRPHQVQTEPKKSVVEATVKRKVRLLLWGGAVKSSDDSTFNWASQTVQRDYGQRDKGKYRIIHEEVKTGREIVNKINTQDADSVQSLDIWTHGSPKAVWLSEADDPETSQFLRDHWYNAALFRSSSARVFFSPMAPILSGTAVISDIDFSRFANNAVVEIHGCNAAHDAGSGNFVADFSKLLYEAGKTKSVVIGHTTQGNPNIHGGSTKKGDQDYRHGKRVAYRNGVIVAIITAPGHVDEKTLTDSGAK